MLVTDSGLTWKAFKRGAYEALGGTGTYYLIADTPNWMYRSRLIFIKDNYGVALSTQLLLAEGLPRQLLRVAEIHNVTNP